MKSHVTTRPVRLLCGGCLAGLLALSACGGVPATSAPGGTRAGKGDGDDQTPTTTLTFAGDWSEQADGVIVAGGKLRIDYDESRLPRCRSSHNGNPGWQITAFVKFLPSETITEAKLFDHPLTPSGTDYHGWAKQIPELDVPAATNQIEVWFNNTSGFDQPCTDWDSDVFGSNYRFNVVPAAPALAFCGDWSVIQHGALTAGGAVTVSYDPQRLDNISHIGSSPYVDYFASRYHCYGYGCCSHDYRFTVHARFADGGDFVAYPLTAELPLTELAIPSDATRVELYFAAEVYTDTWYCGGTTGPVSRQGPDWFYDSNFGANFSFDLEPTL